jgi:hypothetical protein
LIDDPRVQFGDKVFRFIAAGEADDILVIPPKYANELKGLPEEVLDFNAALREVGRRPSSVTWHRCYRRSLHRNGPTFLANADCTLLVFLNDVANRLVFFRAGLLRSRSSSNSGLK